MVEISEISNPTLGKFCGVCGDFASGRYYGALSCLGCKGFFQRVVWRGTIPACKLQKNCVLTKDGRNECKFCRFQKCLRAGMSIEAVKPSKAKPRVRKSSSCKSQIQKSKLPDPFTCNPTYSMLSVFLQAEYYMDSTMGQYFPKVDLKRYNSLQNILDSTNTELHYIVEWSKQIEVFNQLETRSQIALLRAHCTELMFLEVIRRSIDVTGYAVGANGYIFVNAGDPKFDTRPRVFTELIKPCKELGLSEKEFVCLKTLVMFDPYTNGLAEVDKQKVGRFRHQVQLVFEDLLKSKEPGRMSRLLMVLPSLYSIGVQFRGLTRNWQGTGNTQLYKLQEQLILNWNEEPTSDIYSLAE